MLISLIKQATKAFYVIVMFSIMNELLKILLILYNTGVGSGGARGACAPPLFWLGGQWYVCAPPLLTPHFYFPLELYVYITLTNNNLAFLIYQLIILWTITIKWHRWLLVNNHISNYNSFILVFYRRYINHVSVCPPTFWHLATPLYNIYLLAVWSFSICSFSISHGCSFRSLWWRLIYL